MNKEANNAVEEAVAEVVNETREAAELVVSKGDIADVSLLDTLRNTNVTMVCSFKDDGTRAAKVKIYNAIASADEKLDEHKGDVLYIAGFASHPIRLVDDKTGEIINTVRTVLVDKDGIGYECVSEGIISALSRIIGIVGEPETWQEEPVGMIVTEEKTRKGFKVMSVRLVV